MPRQQGVRRNDVGDIIQYSAVYKFSFGRQTASLIICKPKPTSAHLLSQDSILFAQVLDGMLLLLIHPTGYCDDYEPKGSKLFDSYSSA